jgi:hypothetical protein
MVFLQSRAQMAEAEVAGAAAIIGAVAPGLVSIPVDIGSRIESTMCTKPVVGTRNNWPSAIPGQE